MRGFGLDEFNLEEVVSEIYELGEYAKPFAKTINDITNVINSGKEKILLRELKDFF